MDWLVWTVEDYINLILSWEWWEDCCGRCDRAEVSDWRRMISLVKWNQMSSRVCEILSFKIESADSLWHLLEDSLYWSVSALCAQLNLTVFAATHCSGVYTCCTAIKLWEIQFLSVSWGRSWFCQHSFWFLISWCSQSVSTPHVELVPLAWGLNYKPSPA